MKQRIKILPTADPDFNYGRGERFFRAVERMIRENRDGSIPLPASYVAGGFSTAGTDAFPAGRFLPSARAVFANIPPNPPALAKDSGFLPRYPPIHKSLQIMQGGKPCLIRVPGC